MSATRRYFSAPEKVAVLRRHLLEKVPVSELCEELGIAPSLFYLWQRDLFENGHAAFETKGPGRHAKKAEVVKDQRIEALQEKIRRKDEVLAEVMEEYVALKKNLGAI
jgi:transposase-like protein